MAALQAFFAQKPVFTLSEFKKQVMGKRKRSDRTIHSLLNYYKSKGRLLGVRRGLYLVVPPGIEAKRCPLDPFLLASRMTEDAVLAYHSALEFFGKSYSVFQHFYYFTEQVPRKVSIQDLEFRGVPFSEALNTKRKRNYGVLSVERAGLDLKVTSLERTLVDVLDRPSLGGGWEEIWRSLSMVEYFDLTQILRYTRLMENKTLSAKVGFFLSQHRDSLMVEDKHLKQLKSNLPKQAHYLDKNHPGKQRLVKEWNLMVPEALLKQNWRDIS